VSEQSNDSEYVKVFAGDVDGPEEYVGFFEDDGETGYLYVSDRAKGQIAQYVQVYRGSETLGVEEDDVRVVWSRDRTKCGVMIWGGMRGIIDVVNKREGRALILTRDTPPIGDPEWLYGFDEGPA